MDQAQVVALLSQLLSGGQVQQNQGTGVSAPVIPLQLVKPNIFSAGDKVVLPWDGEVIPGTVIGRDYSAKTREAQEGWYVILLCPPKEHKLHDELTSYPVDSIYPDTEQYRAMALTHSGEMVKEGEAKKAQAEFRKVELMAGFPYQKAQLEEMKPQEYVILFSLMGLNPFKVEGNRAEAILSHQKSWLKVQANAKLVAEARNKVRSSVKAVAESLPTQKVTERKAAPVPMKGKVAAKATPPVVRKGNPFGGKTSKK